MDRRRAGVAERCGCRRGSPLGAKPSAAHGGIGHGCRGSEGGDRARRARRRSGRARAFRRFASRSGQFARDWRHAHHAGRSARPRRRPPARRRLVAGNLASFERAVVARAGEALMARGIARRIVWLAPEADAKISGFDGDIEVIAAGLGATLASNFAALRARIKGRAVAQTRIPLPTLDSLAAALRGAQIRFGRLDGGASRGARTRNAQRSRARSKRNDAVFDVASRCARQRRGRARGLRLDDRLSDANRIRIRRAAARSLAIRRRTARDLRGNRLRVVDLSIRGAAAGLARRAGCHRALRAAELNSERSRKCASLSGAPASITTRSCIRRMSGHWSP